MTTPSARARSAIAASIPSHLTWLCSSADFIQPCVFFHGPAKLIDTLEQSSTAQLHVLSGDYDCKLPERSSGSDDEDNDTDVISDSQPGAGIIYYTWFMNRIMYVPALPVLVFRWDDSNFASLRKLINDQVKLFRQSNRTRSGSLMVLIFKTSSPLEDDVLLDRHVMTLRDDLALTEDYVMLSQSYRLTQSVERIVSQIKENALAFYSSCIKTLKRKRSKLGRNSHICYLIRYHIKLGFYSFLSQDVNSAKKYFSSAHKDLVEMQPSSTFQLIEIRDVGLVVSALICRLLILSEDLPGAVEHFDRHIRLMTKMSSDDSFSKPLQFMQFSWLQQEYLVMSQLTQASMAHCLRYVNSAANALTRRMECPFSVSDFDKHYAYQLNELMQKVPFYCGQIQRYDESDCDNTLASDLFLLGESQYRESPNATSLLTVAHNLLLAYPRKRKRQIALSELRIAKHLYRNCNYTAALPLFEKAVNIFRKESWTALLISTLRDVRHACISLGLIPESILYTCELIALVQDGSVTALQKELLLHFLKCQDCLDVSLTGIVAITQKPGTFVLSSKFSPSVMFDSIVVFEESGASHELCRDVATSRESAPFIIQMDLVPQSHAILSMKNASIRVSVLQQNERRCRKMGSVKVTTTLENPVVFVQELYPFSMDIHNSEGYNFYTLISSETDIIVDMDSCEPIVLGDPIPFPDSKSIDSVKVVKAQLHCQSPGNVQVSLRLLGENVPYFEHEVSCRVLKPMEITECFSSLSCSDLGLVDSGHVALRLDCPAILHLQLRNASDLAIYVIEVFFDHDSSLFDMKQSPAIDVGKVVEPGDVITLHFAFIPVQPCNGISPGQIRFNWRRTDSFCIQTYGASLTSSVSVLTPSLYANVHISSAEDIEIGKPCNMTIQIHSHRQTASRVQISAQAPKRVYHIVGPIKSTMWVQAEDSLLLNWKLYPLLPGFQSLPSVKITSESGENLLSDKPLANVFVKPCSIGESNTT